MTPDLQALLADAKYLASVLRTMTEPPETTLDKSADVLDQLAAAVREMAAKVPAEHERFVRCSKEIVAQLIAEPSNPVTIQIEEREHGELHFICTDRRALAQDGERLDWMERYGCDLDTVSGGNWRITDAAGQERAVGFPLRSAIDAAITAEAKE